MGPRRVSLPYLPTTVVAGGAALVAAAVGVLLASDPAMGAALLVALCYLPVALINLPVGIALWLPTTFLNDLPGVDVASHAGGAVIALAWLGTLRARERPWAPGLRAQQWTLAAFVIWLGLSIAWSERPDFAATELFAWAAAAILFVVLITSELEPRQVRMLIAAYIAGVTVSVLIGLIGGIHPQTGLSAITEQEGRLQGGAGDPNYLAAGIVPAIAMAAGLASSLRSTRPRILLAAAVVLMVIGLAATESRGGMLAGVVATLVALGVARRGRAYVVVFIALAIGVGSAWFVATPDAWNRVTNTADAGNGRGSLWRVGGRVLDDHPLVGVGLNNFEVYAPRYVRQAGQLDYVAFIAERPHVVHNLYLQMLIETGFLGLGLFLAVAVASLRACLRAARRFERDGDPGSAALARSVFAAVIAGLTASFFLSNGTEFQLWALLAFGPALMGAAYATRSRRVA